MRADENEAAGHESAIIGLLIKVFWMQALKHGAWVGVRFLAFDAPIFKFLKRDRLSGHRAPHECAWAHDPKISVKILDLRFAGR